MDTFMTSFGAKNPYIKDTVATASPQHLLVMLYDRLVLDLTRAESAIDLRDHGGAHNALVHAQDIVTELRATLDLEVWPEGRQLGLVYDYLGELLVDANLRKDAAPITTCKALIEPIHGAWREIAGLGVTRAA